MTKQDLQKLLRFFLDSSERDWGHFLALKKGKRYDAALFFLHLAIEKKLKALIVAGSKIHPPMTHDLTFLAAKANIAISDDYLSLLRTISTFNIATRYEDEKFEFYKKVNLKYVKTWEGHGIKIIQWIDQKLKKS